MRFFVIMAAAALLSGLVGPSSVAETRSKYAFQASLLKTVVASQNDPQSVTADQLGNTYNFLGMDEKAEAVFPYPETYRRPCEASVSVAKKVPAIELIGNSLDERAPRVLVLNEAHHRSLSRAFARQLLPALKAAGYNTFAVETLSPAGATDQGEVIQGDAGFYSNETEFAELLSDAKRLGFKLIAYEADFSEAPDEDGWIWREKTQAENLIANSKILKDPNVKLVVYVGYGHVADAFLPSATDMSKTFMSGWFKYRTNIDPFGISQTTCQSELDTSKGGLGYQVFLDSSLSPIGGTGVEIVVHPGQPIFFHGRGNWRLQNKKSWFQLPVTFAKLETPLIVEARREGRAAATVPVDRVLVMDQADLAYVRLALPPGRFDVVAINSEGNVLLSGALSVPERADETAKSR